VSYVTPLVLNAWAWAAFAICWMVAWFFTNRTRFAESALLRISHVLPLIVGFFLIFHNRWPAGSFIYGRFYKKDTVEWLGVAMMVGGMLFAGWARAALGRYWSGNVTLKEGHRLIRSGPYRFARHPLYTGFLIAALGSAISAATGDAIVGFAMILAALVIKLRREEALLTGEFGEEYREYKSEVRALVPFIY
jgi:protein-S-isoprenylcysteine O-methyltransferase Ste14